MTLGTLPKCICIVVVVEWIPASVPRLCFRRKTFTQRLSTTPRYGKGALSCHGPWPGARVLGRTYGWDACSIVDPYYWVLSLLAKHWMVVMVFSLFGT